MTKKVTDKMRLDWLDEISSGYGYSHNKKQNAKVVIEFDARVKYGATLRQCIDAAMRRTRRGK